MANLETISIEINANASEAKTGITNLIDSLQSLAKAVGEVDTKLKSLYTSLKSLKSAGAAGGTSIVGGANASASVQNIQRQTAAINEQTKAITANISVRKTTASGLLFMGVNGRGESISQSFNEKKYQLNSALRSIGQNGEEQTAKSLGITVDDLRQRIAALNEEINGGKNSSAAGGLTNKMQEIETSSKNVTSAVNDAKQSTEELTDTIQKSSQNSGALGGFTSMFKRISKAIVSMTIMKPIVRTIRQSLTSLYEYSKKNGGTFADSVDKMKGALMNAAIRITAAFAPALSALTPVVTVVSQAIAYLASVVEWLVKQLGIASEFLGATSQAISDAGDKAKSAKEKMGSMDELNVIGSDSNGSNGNNADFSLVDNVTEDLEKLKLAIGEGLLAIGLILACTGQVGIGIGLMVVGAAAIASVVAVSWGQMSEQTKGELTTIMAACGAAMLAIGAIIALSGGSLPLGIGLMIAGTANLVGAAALSWGLADEVKKKIAVISGAIGGALMAVGAVLAFTGASLPLGIGLMVAGAVGLASSVALTWSLDSSIVEKVGIIGAAVGGALLALGACLAFTGAAIPLGIGLMIAGAAVIGSSAAIAWDTMPNEVKSVVTTIAGIVGGALLAIGAVLCFTGAGIPLGLAMMAAGGVSLVAAIAPNWSAISGKLQEVFGTAVAWLTEKWEGVKTAVTNAWNSVKKWWEDSGIGEKVRNVWDGVSGFFKNLWEGDDGKGGIKGMALGALVASAQWWETNVKSKVEKEGVWGGVKGYFEGLWNTVSTGATNAWGNVTKWWETSGIGEKVRTAWKGVESFFTNIWEGEDGNGGVKGAANSAWDTVKTWWETSGIGTKVTNAWSSAREYLCNAWSTVQNAATNAWNKVSDWWTTSGIGTKVTNAWSGARQYLTDAWNVVKNGVTNAWNKVKDWWTGTDFKTKITNAWSGARQYLTSAWSTIQTGVTNAWKKVSAWWTGTDFKTKIINAWAGARQYLSSAWEVIKNGVKSAYDKVAEWWDTKKTGMVEKVKSAWASVAAWFKKNVTGPIKTAWTTVKNACKGAINFIIRGLNKLGTMTIPEVKISVPDWLQGVFGKEVVLLQKKTVTFWNIPQLAANGAYGMDAGQLFVANEAGAEMVGSMDGKTAVANQQQIVEGIRRGVSDGQQEQNALLREQNRLLMGILQKSGNVTIGASSALGRVVNQSLQMYGQMTGV